MENNLNWNTWLKSGDQYLKAATPKTEKKKFNTAIRYNLLSLSFESYAMAILDFYQVMPDNHTYTDLLTALSYVTTMDKNLVNKILQYENIQSICSMEKYSRRSPNEDEISDLHEAITQVSEKAYSICK